MFDMTKLQIQKMTVKIDGERTLTIPPPKIKLMRAMESCAKGKQDTDSLSNVMVMVLNSNEQGIQFTSDQIDEMFDTATIVAFFNEFKRFQEGILNNPNSKSPAYHKGKR